MVTRSCGFAIRTPPKVQHGLTAPSPPEKAQQRGLNSRRNKVRADLERGRASALENPAEGMDVLDSGCLRVQP